MGFGGGLAIPSVLGTREGETTAVQVLGVTAGFRVLRLCSWGLRLTGLDHWGVLWYLYSKSIQDSILYDFGESGPGVRRI